MNISRICLKTLLKSQTNQIIDDQLVIKLGHFPWDKLNTLMRPIKSEKYTGFDEIPFELRKIRKIVDILLRLSNSVYNQNIIDKEKWTKGFNFLFPKKGDLGITTEL